MRKIWMILLALAFAMPLQAQFQADVNRPARRHTTIGVGVKGGVNLTKFHYSVKALDTLGRDTTGKDPLWMQRLRPVYGVQAEIPFGSCFIFTPELLYMTRCDMRKYKNYPFGDSLTYQAEVHYLDLRLPISLVIPLKSPVQPYLFAGVDLGMVMPYFSKKGSDEGLNLSGTISQGVDETAVNKSNMSPFDVGVFGGLGVRYTMDFDGFSLVAKLEADYSYGLMNTYSKKEQNSQVPAANLGLGGTHYQVGTRQNRGIELFLTVVLPLRFMGDACSGWSDDVYPTHSRVY